MRAIILHTANCAIRMIAFTFLLLSCQKSNQPPTARLDAFPSIGDTTILFEFSAAKSEDERNYPIGLMYRWDLDGNGTWDTEFYHNKTITHRYVQPGRYFISVEARDLDGLTSIARDSIEVFGANRDIDTLIDNRDGNKYRIVKIQNRWWMAENLRYGTEIPTNLEQSDNDTIERYRLLQSRSKDTIGGVYGWLEAMEWHVSEPKGICPDGWHIPTRAEWQMLFAAFPAQYSLLYYGNDGLSKLNLDLNNEATREKNSPEEDLFIEDGQFRGGFWGSTFKTEDTQYLAFIVDFNSATGQLTYIGWDQTRNINIGDDMGYRTVRCIKDN